MGMDFSDVLASSIHDIKNSLGLILTSLDELIGNPENRLADRRQASLLQHEVYRANANLIQLLTLYKLGNAQLALRVAEYNLDEFLEEIVTDNRVVCAAFEQELTWRCDPELSGYFDWDLVRSVLESALGNAQRYARQRILLSAEPEGGFLVIRVEDDGDGFPGSLLDMTAHQQDGMPEATTVEQVAGAGRTRLGFYFASQISQLHRNANKHGRMRLVNGHALPGGCFELWLP